MHLIITFIYLKCLSREIRYLTGLTVKAIN